MAFPKDKILAIDIASQNRLDAKRTQISKNLFLGPRSHPTRQVLGLGKPYPMTQEDLK